MVGDEERRAVQEVLCGTTYVHGPIVSGFEQDFAAFTKAPEALAVASCTAGLHLLYFDLGIGQGDEVIVPAQTHVATAHAVEFCGAHCVFVDAEEGSGNIAIEQIRDAITPNTRAISVVHYLGNPVDMREVNAIAKKHGLFVVEDCALSLGATLDGVHTGLLGDAGCFSFYPVKHMTTAEGGMVITRHADLAGRVGITRAFGVDRTVDKREKSGVYDVTTLGYNYRMNEIAAAIGREQLRRLPGFLESRKRNFSELKARLQEIPELRILDSEVAGAVGSNYCLSIVVGGRAHGRRDELAAAMKAAGVGTSVYYPRPVPHMSYYMEKYGHSRESFPVAANISENSIALPVGPHLEEGDTAYIIDAVKKALFSL